jgi:transcriptional regulator with XRE-family HTH domain
MARPGSPQQLPRAGARDCLKESHVNSIEAWLTQPGGVAPRLKELREAAGLTQPELAGMLGWAQSKVSKLENGKQPPSTEDIGAWVRVCRGNVDTILELQAAVEEAEGIRRDWKRQARRGQVGIQHDYDQLARDATVIRNFETVWVPGLLQTAGYAQYRALEGVDLHEAKAEEVPATVAARMERKSVLYESGRRFEFIVLEEVLRRLVCPPDVMLGQLAHLDLIASGLPGVRFAVIPLGAELKRSPQHGFVIYDDIAIVENYVEEITYRQEPAVKLSRVMDDLAAEAVTGDDARRLIVAAMDMLRG